MKKYLLLLIAFAFFIPHFAHADITTGLVGWYKMDEGSGSTAFDSGSNVFNGTLTNGPTYVAGKIGPYALSFAHSSSQYVHMTSRAVSAYPFTISAWFNMNSNTPSTIASINVGVNTPGGVGNRAELYYFSNQVCLYIQDNANANNFVCGGSVTPGTWYFGTAVFTSDTSFTIYLNGTSVGSGTTPISFNFSLPTETDIGADSDAPNNADAIIDDVRFYSRGLSSSDITELYNYTAPVTGMINRFSVSIGRRFSVAMGRLFSIR